MRTKMQLVVSVIVMLISLPMAAQERGGQRGAPAAPAGPAMTLTIPAFPDGGQFPVKYSQAAEGVAPGEGTSPAISWANPPAGTQSFVLNMRDMDVARNRTTDDQAHWVVWNIPGTATGLPEGVPEGSSTRGWKLSDQRHRPDVSRSRCAGDRTAASLHVRALRVGHQARCPTHQRCVRDTRERHESHARAHSGESGLRRTVQAAQVGVTT